MPLAELSAWNPTLHLIQSVIDRYHIPLKKVRLHYHPRARKIWNEKHPFGESYYTHAEMTLCSKDFDTALHEIAHLWARNQHTDKWARCYLHLLEKYLTREEFMAKMERAKKVYKPVYRMAHLFELDFDEHD